MKNIITVLTITFMLTSCCESVDYAPATDVQGQGGSLATFALNGGFLYAVDNSALSVFSLSTLDSPVYKTRIEIGVNIETLFSQNGYLFVGSRNAMYIYDLVDPAHPKKMSDVRHFTACDPVVANDSLAFVTLHSNVRCRNNVNLLEVYDVTDVTTPKLLKSIVLEQPKGLGLYKNFLLVCDDKIKIFDVSDPKNMTVIDTIDETAFDVIIKDNRLIAVGNDGIYQYDLDISDNTLNHTHLSTISF